MPDAGEITSTFNQIRTQLRRLLDATPTDSPRYAELDARYDEVHAFEQKNLIGAIAAADADYALFTTRAEALIDEITAAQKDIERVAKVIDKAAMFVEVAGKVAKKLAV